MRVVSVLNFPGSPPAVSRPSVRAALLAVAARIVPVVLDPIDTDGRGHPRPHVGKERGERSGPPATDSDTPAAVSGVSLRGFVQAPLADTFPNPVLCRAGQAVGSAVGHGTGVRTPPSCSFPQDAGAGRVR